MIVFSKLNLCYSCCSCCAALPEEQGGRGGGRVGPVLQAPQGHVEDQCGREDHRCRSPDSSLYSLLCGRLPTGTPHPFPRGSVWNWSGPVHNQQTGGRGGAEPPGGDWDRRAGRPSWNIGQWATLAQSEPKRNLSCLRHLQSITAAGWWWGKCRKMKKGLFRRRKHFFQEIEQSIHSCSATYLESDPRSSILCRDHQTSLAPVSSPGPPAHPGSASNSPSGGKKHRPNPTWLALLNVEKQQLYFNLLLSDWTPRPEVERSSDSSLLVHTKEWMNHNQPNTDLDLCACGAVDRPATILPIDYAWGYSFGQMVSAQAFLSRSLGFKTHLGPQCRVAFSLQVHFVQKVINKTSWWRWTSSHTTLKTEITIQHFKCSCVV